MEKCWRLFIWVLKSDMMWSGGGGGEVLREGSVRNVGEPLRGNVGDSHKDNVEDLGGNAGDPIGGIFRNPLRGNIGGPPRMFMAILTKCIRISKT